ncbi:MAG: alpha/beta hydrolase [Clostridia bacterium]|nr:alpha/beta hydrolase [Clostridia bacterium]
MPNNKKAFKKYDIPPGEEFEPFREQMVSWMKEAEGYKSENITIKSYDGKTLHGTYYESFEGGPIEIMFHGYRGSSQRDLCGGLNRCHKLKRNVLLVDQRSHGKSEGNVISFGIKERYDVKSWCEYAFKRFGENVPLLITGISMGAGTVLMASSLPLPKTVVGVIADCGYSSIKEVIKVSIRNMKLPADICYPFVRLGGIIFGGFDVEQTSPEQELKKSVLPTVFVHGDNDKIVPVEMSKLNYDACNATNKKLVIIKDAAHGAAYLVDPNKYVNELEEFKSNYIRV